MIFPLTLGAKIPQGPLASLAPFFKGGSRVERCRLGKVHLPNVCECMTIDVGQSRSLQEAQRIAGVVVMPSPTRIAPRSIRATWTVTMTMHWELI